MSTVLPFLGLRADASPTIGTGHVMRMLALAQAWRRTGGRAVFVAAEMPDGIRTRVEAEGFSVLAIPVPENPDVDAALTLEALSRVAAPAGSAVAADGYRFPADFQTRLMGAGIRLLIVDDNGENGSYASSLVLNQNVHASVAFYAHRAPETRLLLGPRFALLRDEFLRPSADPQPRTIERRHVLITMGGSDPAAITSALIGHLRGRNLTIRAVVGAGNPRRRELEALRADGIEVLSQVGDMPGMLDWADVVVTAGGSTLWEICHRGLPAVAIAIAENQRALVRAMAQAGLAVDAGDDTNLDYGRVVQFVEALLHDDGWRERLRTAGRCAVDGEGAARVASALRGDPFFLRPARIGDAQRMWDWRNDEATRAASFSGAVVPFPAHVDWLRDRLSRPAVRILMAEQEGTEFGVIRFEADGESAVVSVMLAPGFRGRGLAAPLIAAATARSARELRLVRIHAYIKPGNEASTRAFTSAGYREIGRAVVDACEAHHLIWEAA